VQWDNVKVASIKLHYGQVGMSQWQWLLFVTSFSLLPAAGFVLVEIFRETKPGEDKNTKVEWETILEGFSLLLLVILWIPSVIVATTPGGAASFVGNGTFPVLSVPQSLLYHSLFANSPLCFVFYISLAYFSVWFRCRYISLVDS
jgi:hypothetical protein